MLAIVQRWIEDALRVRAAQLEVLLAQLLQLVALLTAQQIAPPAAIGLGLADPVTQ